MSNLGEFPGAVTGGKLPVSILQGLGKVAEQLEGKRVVVSIREQKRKRSSNQNAFYFGVVVPAVTAMFREAGNYVDESDIHTFLKMKVGKLSRVVVMPDGEAVKTLGSTAKLSTVEFENYITMVRAWAAEWGCEIPMPNEEGA